MNRKLTLILFLLFVIIHESAFPQEFEVKSFRKDASDLSAIKYGRKDVNNMDCAIIKVRTNLMGLSFDCNLKITGNVEVKPDEVWLYISPKEKRLKFMKEGFLSMDYPISEPIEASTVYVLELVSKNPIVIKPGIAIGFVLLKSFPSGAEVILNGESTGLRTPVQKALNPGKYDYELRNNLYLPSFNSFEIIAGKTVTLEEILKPNFGKLSLDCKPENGAEIMLDDRLLKVRTPAIIDTVLSGRHKITLRKDMFESFSSEVYIIPGENKVLNLTLQPTFGEINICAPKGSSIFLDQQKVGTKDFASRLIKGFHLVEVKAKNFYDFCETVTIEVGQTRQMNISLTPIRGSLTVSTDPPEVDVLIDGVKKGTSPLIIDGLIIGSHDLELSKVGYGTVSKQINITENQTLEINEILSNVTSVTINSSPTEAQLQVDGTDKGTTPVSIPLTFGDHIVTLSKSRFNDLTQAIRVSNSETSFFLTLDRKSVDVNFTTSPPGADLSIDNVFRGKTPVDLLLPFGKYSLRLTKEKYNVLERDISIDEKTTSFSFSLEPEFIAVQFTSLPSSADLYIDEQYKGMTPIRVEVSPGHHYIKMVKNGYLETSKDEDIYVDQDLKYSLKKEYVGRTESIVEKKPLKKRTKQTSTQEDLPRRVSGIGGQYYFSEMTAFYKSGNDSVEVPYSNGFGGTLWFRYISKNYRFGTEFSFALTILENKSPDKTLYKNDQTATLMPLQIVEDWYFVKRTHRVFLFIGVGVGFIYGKQYSYKSEQDEESYYYILPLRCGIGVRLSPSMGLEINYSYTIGGGEPISNVRYGNLQTGLTFAF